MGNVGFEEEGARDLAEESEVHQIGDRQEDDTQLEQAEQNERSGNV
jgi:hypothetical protein